MVKLSADKTDEQVIRSSYLKVKTASFNNPISEASQANKAAATSSCQNKMKICEACVRPITTYGIEVRAKYIPRRTEIENIKGNTPRYNKEHEFLKYVK